MAKSIERIGQPDDEVLRAIMRAPIAHRGLHDSQLPENSLAAVEAAVSAGFGVEIDVRRSSDGVPMVIHDATLQRVAGVKTRVRDASALQLRNVRLAGSTSSEHGVPRLVDVLRLVDGRVPVVVDAKCRPAEGPAMAASLAHALACYTGPVAVTSFDPTVVRVIARRAPQVARGLIAGIPNVADSAFVRRFGVPLDDLWAARFCRPQLISFNIDRLPAPAATAMRAQGLPLIGWTARTRSDAQRVAPYVDGLIVEGELATELAAPAEAAGASPRADADLPAARAERAAQRLIGLMSA